MPIYNFDTIFYLLDCLFFDINGKRLPAPASPSRGIHYMRTSKVGFISKTIEQIPRVCEPRPLTLIKKDQMSRI
jgi:hypothetical protein